MSNRPKAKLRCKSEVIANGRRSGIQRSILAVLVNALFLACPSSGAQASTMDDVQKLNGQFRSMYAKARTETLSKMGPIIILSNGEMTLIRADKQEVYAYLPDEWTVLKTVDHVGLGIFVTLRNHVGEKLSDETLSDLTTFKSLINTCLASLNNFSFVSVAASGAPNRRPAIDGKSTAQRQQEMLKEDLSFIDGVLSAKFVSFADLQSFAKKLAGPSLENAYTAASFELAAIDSKIQQWRKSMSREEWQRVHIVITGSHMARSKERTMQYFLTLLGETFEGDRVIYNEGANDQKSSLDLLGTHVLDSMAATAFFDDKMRLHRDLLSDGAAKYLRQVKTQKLE